MITKEDGLYKIVVDIPEDDASDELYQELKDKINTYGMPSVNYAWFVDRCKIELDIKCANEDPDVDDDIAMEELLGVMA